jgi:aspartate racemase
MIDVCLASIEKHFQKVGNKTPVGILGGKGCMVGRVYQDALERRGMEFFVLDEGKQDEAMEAIYCVKQGKNKEARRIFRPVFDTMVSAGCKTVILGCTEIPIIIKEDFVLPEDVAFFDSCDILADAVVRVANGMNGIDEVV